MRQKIIKTSFIVLGTAALSACATGPTPPPQPDMTQLVPVNRAIPPQLVGQKGVTLPDQGQHSSGTKDKRDKHVR